MNLPSVEEEFRERISEKIELLQQGENRFLVKTPFRFEDGDHFTIVLKQTLNSWVLTDEANTIMHLSYWLDTDALEAEGNRKHIVDSALSTFSVENRDGELVLPIVENRFGDALFNFVQALAKVTDVSFLSREVVRSTFMEDLRAFLKSKVPEDRIEFDWTDARDANGKYPVDFRVNQLKRPLFIYGIPNEDKLKDTTISLLTFERWGLKFQSIGIFEEQQEIARKSLARFTDVVVKSYSNFHENRERIGLYLEEALNEG